MAKKTQTPTRNRDSQTRRPAVQRPGIARRQQWVIIYGWKHMKNNGGKYYRYMVVHLIVCPSGRPSVRLSVGPFIGINYFIIIINQRRNRKGWKKSMTETLLQRPIYELNVNKVNYSNKFYWNNSDFFSNKKRIHKSDLTLRKNKSSGRNKTLKYLTMV